MGHQTPAHPYAEIFPLVHGQAIKELGERILANGLREPIVLLDEQILDGRCRELACLNVGVNPEYRQFGDRATDGADPLEFVIDTNLHRRHLSDNELSLAAARYATAQVEQQQQDIPSVQIEPMEIDQTKDDAAEKFKVSPSKVKRAKKIINSGIPDIVAAVSNDEVAIGDAAEVVVEPAPIQEEAIKRVREGSAKTLRGAVEDIKAQEPEPMPDDSPWVDEWGIPITKEAAAAFKDAEKFDELIKVLRQAKKLFKELADLPAGKFLQRPFVSANSRTGFRHNGLETCIMNVIDCKPTYTCCPYAFAENHVHDHTCSLCKGLNWLGKVNTTSGPPQELIEKAKKALGAIHV